METTTTKKQSSDFEWKMEREYFRFFSRGYDVKKAKEIIVKTPREVNVMGLSGVKNMVKRPQRDEKGQITSFSLGISVDWDRIDSTTEIDLDFPTILANHGNGDYWPIDGWHRIAKAVDMGQESLPVVVLSEEETKQVSI